MEKDNPENLITIGNFLGSSNFCFGIWGLEVARNSTKRPNLFQRICQIIDAFCVTTIAAQITLLCVLELGKPDAFLQITHNMSAISFVSMAYVKLYMTLIRQKSLIDEILEDIESMFPSTRKQQEKYKVKEFLTSLRRQDMIYHTSQVVHILFFNVFGIVVSVIGYYFVDGVYLLELQLYYWFPFNFTTDSIITFVIYYFMTSVTCIGAVIMLSAVDLLFTGVLALVSLEFNILSDKLRHFDTLVDESLNDLIKIHYKLIELTEKIDKLFTICMLYNFSGSTLVLCFTGFQAITNSSFISFFRFTFFLITSLYQIFLICYQGDKLMRSSMSISEGIAGSNWVNADNQTKKSLQLMILRANKPQTVKAYKMAQVCIPSFTRILSSSYSYFTLLRAVYKPPVVV
uniref:Odorant receptor n=1 Tax=Propsilocerus akamusi TaxID=903466 RepID=A0A7D0PCB5_9DIPT|nr:odorant receptor 7 [Propsilocerus akamusi]